MKVIDLKKVLNKVDEQGEVYLMDPGSGEEAAISSAVRVCKNKDGSVTLVTCGYVVASKKTQDYVLNCAIDMEEK